MIGASHLTGALIGALTVILAASAPPESPDVGARVAAAMTAEQSLQGPLDGAWLVHDAGGRPLYRLQIVDPAGGQGPLTGAWRDARGEAAGFIARIRRTARILRLEFPPAGDQVITLHLKERSPDVWSGLIIKDGVRRAVVLRRG